MGKLLFVNTNRVNGIFGVIICAGLIVIGVWSGVEGAYGWLLLVPAGLFAGKFCVKLATMRSELYEQGFVTASCFGAVKARYGDLQSITRFAIRVNGVLNTRVHFVTKSGETATLTRESLRQDDKMAQLLHHASEALASTWLKTLDRQQEVVWIVKGTSPLIRIRKDGVIVHEENEPEEFIPLSELNLKAGLATAVVICRRDDERVEVDSAARNYFVGEKLIAMLHEKQSAPAVTPSPDTVAEKRPLTSRAAKSIG